MSIAHVGDSRLYHAANGQLVQLTRDDSWAATVLGQRPLDGAAPAEQHPMRHVLTNVLGARDNTEIHIQERQVGPSEMLLLCTDGLHGSLDDAQIQELLAQQSSMERTAEALVRAALERGSRDNVTALVGRLRGVITVVAEHPSSVHARSASAATRSSTGSAAARWESSTRRTTS